MATQTTTKLSVALAFALAAGLATAAELKIPKDARLPMGEGSPGPVSFSHDSHVDAAKPSCTTCHPTDFSILKKTSAAGRKAITHDAMEKGKQSCGACHGSTAFGFDDCTMCHGS